MTFTPRTDADFSIDNIRILSDDLSNTTTFAVNNANELTSMTDYNGSTTFGFDDWGRMTSKARGSYEAKYGYRYGQMLCAVTSDFPGEGNVTYEYTGDKRLWETSSPSGNSWYNWRSRSSVVSVEDDQGDLILTNVSGLANRDAMGTYEYRLRDRVRTTRIVRGEDKATSESSEFDPYGSDYASSGSSTSRMFAALRLHPDLDIYQSQNRFYSPETTRWLTRDPAGMTDSSNLYLYVKANPTNYIDPTGTAIWKCYRSTLMGVGMHAYMWDDREGPLRNRVTRSCGTSGMFGFGNPWLDKDELGPGRNNDYCVKVNGSDGLENKLMMCCQAAANDGLWIPYDNDCHNAVDDCLAKWGLEQPPLPLGRTPIDDAARQGAGNLYNQTCDFLGRCIRGLLCELSGPYDPY